MVRGAQNKNETQERAFSAGLIIYRRTEEGPKFLVMYHRGRYWNFPKGKIEPGEKSIEAALRETEEETGLTKEDLRIKRGFRVHERFRFTSGRNKVHKTVILFLAEAEKKSIDISKGRHEEGYGWFLYRDARRLFEGYKESQAALKSAQEYITRRRFGQWRPGKHSSPRRRRRSQRGS